MALRYQAYREVNSQDGSEDIVMIEQYAALHSPSLLCSRCTPHSHVMGLNHTSRYENTAALEQHSKSEDFLDWARRLKEEDLLAKPLVVKVLRPVAGFASRL